MVDCSKIVLRVSKGKHNIYQLYTTLHSWPNIYIYICNVCDRDAMRTQAQHPTKPKHKLEQIRTERNEGNRNSFVLFTKTQIICSLYTLFSLRERVLKSVYVLREKLQVKLRRQRRVEKTVFLQRYFSVYQFRMYR